MWAGPLRSGDLTLTLPWEKVGSKDALGGQAGLDPRLLPSGKDTCSRWLLVEMLKGTDSPAQDVSPLSTWLCALSRSCSNQPWHRSGRLCFPSAVSQPWSHGTSQGVHGAGGRCFHLDPVMLLRAREAKGWETLLFRFVARVGVGPVAGTLGWGSLLLVKSLSCLPGWAQS